MRIELTLSNNCKDIVCNETIINYVKFMLGFESNKNKGLEVAYFLRNQEDETIWLYNMNVICNNEENDIKYYATNFEFESKKLYFTREIIHVKIDDLNTLFTLIKDDVTKLNEMIKKEIEVK